MTHKVWSIERQRRSTVVWEEIVPRSVAIGQTAWERRQTALALVEAGYDTRTAGVLFGVSSQRISDMTITARLWRDRPSPVETYFAEREEPVRGHLRRDVIRALAAWPRTRRQA